MNVPGRAEGNWRWRYQPKDLTPEIIDRLRVFTLAGQRCQEKQLTPA